MVEPLLSSSDSSHESKKGWTGRDKTPVTAVGGDGGRDDVATNIEYKQPPECLSHDTR